MAPRGTPKNARMFRQLMHELSHEIENAEIENRAYIEGELYTLKTFFQENGQDYEAFLKTVTAMIDRLVENRSEELAADSSTSKDFYFYCGSRDMAQEILSSMNRNR